MDDKPTRRRVNTAPVEVPTLPVSPLREAAEAKVLESFYAEQPREPLTELVLRTWTDSTGKYLVEAGFVEAKDGEVKLLKSDCTLKTLPLERLSAADQEWIKNRKKR